MPTDLVNEILFTLWKNLVHAIEATEKCLGRDAKTASPELVLSARAEILHHLVEELRKTEAPGYEIGDCILENDQLQLLRTKLKKLNHLKIFFQESTDKAPTPLPRIDLSYFKKLKALELLLLGSTDELVGVVDFDCTDSNSHGCFSLKVFKATNDASALDVENGVHLSGSRKLCLSNNLLTSVPNLQHCMRSTVSDLSSNQIRTLWSSIRHMRQLKWVSLSRNWLRSTEGLKILPHLQRLDLPENRMSDSAQNLRLMKLNTLRLSNVCDNPVTRQAEGESPNVGFMRPSSGQPFLYRRGRCRAGEAEKSSVRMKMTDSESSKSGRDTDSVQGKSSGGSLEEGSPGTKLEGDAETGNNEEPSCVEDIGRNHLLLSPVRRKLSGIRYDKVASRIPKRRAAIRDVENHDCETLEQKKKGLAFRALNEEKFKEELDRLQKFHQENGTMWLLIYNHYRAGGRRPTSETAFEGGYAELCEPAKRVHDHPEGNGMEKVGRLDKRKSSESLRKDEIREMEEENNKGSCIEEPELSLDKRHGTELPKEAFNVYRKEKKADEISWFDCILSVSDYYIEEFDDMTCKLRFSIFDLDEVIESEEQKQSSDGAADFDSRLDVIFKSHRFIGDRLYRFRMLDEKIRALNLIERRRLKEGGRSPEDEPIRLEKGIEQNMPDECTEQNSLGEEHNTEQGLYSLDEKQHNTEQNLYPLDEKLHSIEQTLNDEPAKSADLKGKEGRVESHQPRYDSRYFAFLLDLKFLACNELDSEGISEIQLQSIAPNLTEEESLSLCIPGFYLVYQAKTAREKLAILLVTTRTLLFLTKSNPSFYRVFQPLQTGSLYNVMSMPLGSLASKFKPFLSKPIGSVVRLLVGPFRQWLRFEFSDYPPIMLVTRASLRTLKFVKLFEELVSQTVGSFRAVYNNDEFLLHLHKCLQKTKIHTPLIIDAYALVYQLLDASPAFHLLPLFHSSKTKYLMRSLVLTPCEILLLDEDYSKWPSLDSRYWNPPKTPQFTLIERIKYKHLLSLVLEEPNAPDNFLCLRVSFDSVQSSSFRLPAKRRLFSKWASPADSVVSIRLLVANEVERSYIIQVISSRWRSIFAVPIPIESSAP